VTTLRAWQFADERLCSIEVARRGGLDQVRTERFGDREDRVWEHHPAFTIQVAFYGDTEPGPGHEEDSAGGGLDIPAQADQVAGLFAQPGWDQAVTARIVEAILGRLAQAGSRPAAYESLRRDDQVRTMVDLARDSWTGLLRILLGTPRVGWAHTRLGQGILLRMALGETIDDLRRDDAVTGAIAVLTPPGTGGGGVVA
jgi:hypothetical protein